MKTRPAMLYSLNLWRFERHYRLSADQLPKVLRREGLDAGALGR